MGQLHELSHRRLPGASHLQATGPGGTTAPGGTKRGWDPCQSHPLPKMLYWVSRSPSAAAPIGPPPQRIETWLVEPDDQGITLIADDLPDLFVEPILDD